MNCVDYAFLRRRINTQRIMKRKTTTIYLLAAASLLLTQCTPQSEMIPTNLRTEFLSEPIGLDTQQPRFTWEYMGNQADFQVSRQEIRIGTDPNDLRPYEEGMKLLPHTRYYWTVQVWDAQGHMTAPSCIASFETAKFEEADWTAQWISDGQDKQL